MQIVAATGAVLEQMSIDEAYSTFSSLCTRPDHDDASLAACRSRRELKQRIQAERQLTATIGIASNKLLAKIASDHQKPDGLTLIAEKRKGELFFGRCRSARCSAWESVTEKVLNGAGIGIVGDLQDYRGDLRALVGSFGPKLKKFAFGEDDRPLELGDEIKSISGEETFLNDTEDRKVLRACLRTQADDISARLKRRRLGAHTVQVKVRYGDFTTLTRQITVGRTVVRKPPTFTGLAVFCWAGTSSCRARCVCWGLGSARCANRVENNWRCYNRLCHPTLSPNFVTELCHRTLSPNFVTELCHPTPLRRLSLCRFPGWEGTIRDKSDERRSAEFPTKLRPADPKAFEAPAAVAAGDRPRQSSRESSRARCLRAGCSRRRMSFAEARIVPLR